VSEETRKALEQHIDTEWVKQTSYEQNINLRKVLTNKVATKTTDGTWELKEATCNWILTNWGGTEKSKALKPSTKAIILDRLHRWTLAAAQPINSTVSRELPFDRISSWSKILALAFPSECAIFDSRTAYALNWLQFKINLARPVATHFKYWPVPSGRNTLIDMLDYSSLLTALSADTYLNAVRKEQARMGRETTKLSRSRLANRLRRSLEIEGDLAYITYCDVLKAVSNEVFQNEEDSLLKTEMLIFASATGAFPIEVAETLNSSIQHMRAALDPAPRVD
jgi:hypothetical protein